MSSPGQQLAGEPLVGPNAATAASILRALGTDLAPRGYPPPNFSGTAVHKLMATATDDHLRALGLRLITLIGADGPALEKAVGARVPPDVLWVLAIRVKEAAGSVERRKLAWTLSDAREAVSLVIDGSGRWHVASLRLVLAISEAVAPTDWDNDLRLEMGKLHQLLLGAGVYLGNDGPRLLARLTNLVEPPANAWETGLSNDDGWARAVKVELSKLTVDDLAGLLQRLRAAKVRPSEAWTAEMTLRMGDPGARSAVRAMVDELQRHEPTTRTVSLDGRPYVVGHPLLDEKNTEVARGAIWAVALVGEDWAVPTLRGCSAYCGSPSQGQGTPRGEKLAKACAGALGTVASDQAVAALSWLQSGLRSRTVLRAVDTALSAVAAERGLTASELLELAVPTLGLDERGERAEAFGDYVARLRLAPGALTLSFETSSGRRVASIPRALKEDHSNELAGLRAVVKEAKKVLAVERARIEALLATERTWALEEWAERYLHHPVTGRFARCLLWQFGDDADWATLWPSGDQFVGATGTELSVPAGRVRLWHPALEGAEAIAGWRSLLVEREVRQPFKQAFREIYRITPAEQATEVYSNRFAAHILSYPRAFALFRARGWKAGALGHWDGGQEAEAAREFPDAGIRAVFYYGLVEEDGADRSATPPFCFTDQVRFERLNGAAGRRMALAEVPPLVFSEAMRDVDLFVGVASIGADPTWTDRGLAPDLAPYWHDYSTAVLTESGSSRRDALERIMPKTKIAGLCSLTDRFLIVTGTMTTYKIHIGSGNILMEPDDSYLCIQPDRHPGQAGQLYLPFEEDGLLSVIISKAFLLAEDDKITDSTILAQLRRR